MRYSGPELTVGDFMTAPVHTLPGGSSLAAAHELMTRLGVRHLPVLGPDGTVAGVLSDRELSLAKRPRGVDPSDVLVDEVMARPAYAVEPNAPLLQVAGQLARRKYGCAVVQRSGVPVGIFTTTDALRALASFMSPETQKAQV